MIAQFALYAVCTATVLAGTYDRSKENRDFWNKLAKDDLRSVMGFQEDKSRIAKNVIFFLGDGMGPSTVTAARIYKGQLKGNPGEEESLEWDRFPHVGMLKTYNTDSQVSDSAGTATAYLGGVKANIGTLGVTQQVLSENCSTYDSKHDVQSILVRSAGAGKSVGFITTTRITHATPGAAYAHTAFRLLEDDTAVNKIVKKEEDRAKCVDIAQQFVNNALDFRWVMGGGADKFLPKSKGGSRSDGQDLIEVWKKRQAAEGRKYKVLRNKADFDAFKPEDADYVLALVANKLMPYQLSKDPEGISMADMTEKAMAVLSKNPKGYLLFVEGGLIDKGHHKNMAQLALDETVNMDRAVQRALELQDKENTLTMVTADHSHTFTLGGFPSRGRSLLDFTDWKEWGSPEGAGMARDGLPHTAMQYANGPGAPRGPIAGKTRAKLTKDVLQRAKFMWPAAVPLNIETHGGEDVGVYATGPGSWLFHKTHEQNYVAHAVMMASCVGLYVDEPRCAGYSPTTGQSMSGKAISMHQVSTFSAAVTSTVCLWTYSSLYYL